MPRTICLEPGCQVLVDIPGRCATHARQHDRAIKARQPWRAYGRDWRRNRKRVLAGQPTCPCGAPAREVDHIVPLRLGGTHARSNLIALCKPCHSRKTAGETRFGR